MQHLSSDFRFADAHEHEFIHPMLPTALGELPFHQNSHAIIPYFARTFPFHIVVHEISPAIALTGVDTLPHVHEDFDEINLIISHQDLLYKIQIGDDRFIVSNNSCVWIPRGTLHAANLLSGAGHFITMRFN